MSESETQRIWTELSKLGNNIAGMTSLVEGQQTMLAEVREDVKKMSVNGCAKATQHSDHEARLRSLETSRNVAVGMAAVIGSVLGTIGGWLMTRLGGMH